MLQQSRRSPSTCLALFCAILLLVVAGRGVAQQTACATLDPAAITGGGTLGTDSCYEVQGPLYVKSGTLTIEPGVRISFSDRGFLSIASDGRLDARGTADKPIVLTSIDAAGNWRGVRFDNSRSADNVLRHVTIENGGSSGWSGAGHSSGALLLEGASLVDIQHSTFTGSASQGITAYEGTELVFENNTLSNNAVAAWVHPDTAGYIAGTNVFSGNADNVVRVGFGGSDGVSSAQTWHGSVPFEVQDRTWIRAALTLEPGTRIAFRPDVQVNVVEGGSLTAAGTADSPIVLTSVAGLEGNWQGLRIQTSAAANRFDHVVFENGGSRPWTGAPDSSAMVYLEDTSRAVFTSSAFRGSDHYALWVPEAGDIDGFSGNTFTGNARAMIIHPNRAGEIAADNTFEGNTENRVRVTFGNNDRVSDAQTWNDFGAPFYVTDRTFVAAPLTIAPGTELEFAQDASLRVRDDGSLRASGTAGNPVVFRGGEDFPGYWFGIEYNTLKGDNVLEHTVIRNAGSGQWYGGGDAAASIHVDADGAVKLINATIEETDGYALIIRQGGRVSCESVDGDGLQMLVWTGQGAATQPVCP